LLKKSSKREVALSACLLGNACRYDGDDNLNRTLLSQLHSYEIIPFCPEDFAFGTPRPTMDLVDDQVSIRAISNADGRDLSEPIIEYANSFFSQHPNIELFIGKDRSPSCAVCSGKVYDSDKQLLHKNGTGLMAKVAKEFGIESWDAEEYEVNHIS
jgi:uncharacterized protein YbbK (DUF523 family)